MTARHEWAAPPGGGWDCGRCGYIWSDYSIHFDVRPCVLEPGHPGPHKPASRQCGAPVEDAQQVRGEGDQPAEVTPLPTRLVFDPGPAPNFALPVIPIEGDDRARLAEVEALYDRLTEWDFLNNPVAQSLRYILRGEGDRRG